MLLVYFSCEGQCCWCVSDVNGNVVGVFLCSMLSFALYKPQTQLDCLEKPEFDCTQKDTFLANVLLYRHIAYTSGRISC